MNKRHFVLVRQKEKNQNSGKNYALLDDGERPSLPKNGAGNAGEGTQDKARPPVLLRRAVVPTAPVRAGTPARAEERTEERSAAMAPEVANKPAPDQDVKSKSVQGEIVEPDVVKTGQTKVTPAQPQVIDLTPTNVNPAPARPAKAAAGDKPVEDKHYALVETGKPSFVPPLAASADGTPAKLAHPPVLLRRAIRPAAAPRAESTSNLVAQRVVVSPEAMQTKRLQPEMVQAEAVSAVEPKTVPPEVTKVLEPVAAVEPVAVEPVAVETAKVERQKTGFETMEMDAVQIPGPLPEASHASQAQPSSEREVATKKLVAEPAPSIVTEVASAVIEPEASRFEKVESARVEPVVETVSTAPANVGPARREPVPVPASAPVEPEADSESAMQNVQVEYEEGPRSRRNGKPRPASAGPLIRLENVVKAYQTPVGQFMALRGINLEIDRGEFVAVVGKSGSGKSTLINMITGIDRPTSGEIYVDDSPIHNLSEGAMAVWRGRNIGIIFQFFQLLPMLSCVENVMLPMDFGNVFKASEREARALHLLELVDMAEHAYKLPSEVSGGQQQRVAIARALANDPPLLVADEPTGNLDSRTADAVFMLFDDLVRRGKTILMVTHDEELANRVTRKITIADGEVQSEEHQNPRAAPAAQPAR